ncbi:MAG: hypothetical protein V1934_06825 [Methanobacteriota archaeon]
MKLNLGCGHEYMEGWVNVDAPKDELCYDDLKADLHARIEDLAYPDGAIEEINLKAVFEHFPRHVAIMQLRKFYKWLSHDGGKLTILVPDFWGTVEMMRKSGSPQERQFWYRHLFGPQDTIQYGTHYDSFDLEKLDQIFSIVGFAKGEHTIIKRWPSIIYTGIKTGPVKTDSDAERDIIAYLANYETRDEAGIAFAAWMRSIGLEAKKPQTPVFATHEMRGTESVFDRFKRRR